MAHVNLTERVVNYVRNSIDLIIGKDGEYPVLETMLLSQGIATKQQLKALEDAGHIKAIKVKLSSDILPGESLKYRAYYTERNIPLYVKDKGATSEE